MYTQQLTKITLAWELFESGISQIHIADKLDLNRDTIRVWIKAIKQVGLLDFLEDYTNAKKGTTHTGCGVARHLGTKQRKITFLVFSEILANFLPKILRDIRIDNT